MIAAEPALPLPLPPPRLGAFLVVDRLLRDRAAMLQRIRDGVDLAATLRVMIATIAVAMAIVGAALGSFRGGSQIAFAAVKLPIVLLGTAMLSAPVLAAVGAALGHRSRLATDVALVTAALAYGALLLVACTPLLLLADALALAYHRQILLVVVMFAGAGLASLHAIVTTARAPRAAIAALCVVFALVGGQLAWALRPYLVRPRTPDVPFLRHVEGSLWDAVSDSYDSARAQYHRHRAPLPGDAP